MSLPVTPYSSSTQQIRRYGLSFPWVCLVLMTVNSIDSETMPMTEEKRNLDDVNQAMMRPILPYSSMFVFGQTNP